MTEQELRIRFIGRAKDFYGAAKGDARHKEIVEVYNSYLPHPRGYKLTNKDNWCAAFVSAIAIRCGMTDIIPVECSCGEQIKLWQKMGRWEENDKYRPRIGDLLYYDWQDSKNYANYDNKGAPEHVGIVVWCIGDDILVIEGNKGNASVVGYREMNINGRYIRGFGLPDFAALADEASEKASDAPAAAPKNGAAVCLAELPVLAYGAKGEAVRALQALLNVRLSSVLAVDGSFGPATRAAVYEFQLDHGLDVDGSVGAETWGRLVQG